MKKRLKLACLLLCVCLACCGCLRGTALDDFQYVIYVGIDPGKQKLRNYSFLLQAEHGGGESQSASGGTIVMSIEADNIFEAIETLYPGNLYRMNFTRVGGIIYNAELAAKGEMEQLSNLALNSLRVRQSCRLMVSMCNAYDCLRGLSEQEDTNITRLQYSMYHDYQDQGLVPITNFSLVNEAVLSGRSDPLLTLLHVDESAAKTGSNAEQQQGAPKSGTQSSDQDAQKDQGGAESTTGGVTRTGGSSTYALGSALFDGWSLRGVLDGDDTRYLLLARGEFYSGLFTMQYEEDCVTFFLIRRDPPNVKMDLSGPPKAEVLLRLRCDIALDAKDQRGRWEEGLGEAMERFLENEIARVFVRCKALGSDAMGFGRHACTLFHNTQAWESYGWKSRYPEMEATFTVQLELSDENMSVRLE